MYEGERGENKREEKLENTALSLSPGRWRWKNSEEHGKLPGINLDAPVGQREEGSGRREGGGWTQVWTWQESRAVKKKKLKVKDEECEKNEQKNENV